MTATMCYSATDILTANTQKKTQKMLLELQAYRLSDTPAHWLGIWLELEWPGHLETSGWTGLLCAPSSDQQ